MSSHDEEEILKLSSQREGAIRLEGFSTSRDLNSEGWDFACWVCTSRVGGTSVKSSLEPIQFKYL